MANYKIETFSPQVQLTKQLITKEIGRLQRIYESTTQVNLSLTYYLSGRGGMNISFIDMQDKNILGFCEKRGSFYHLSFSTLLLSEAVSYEVLKEVVGHEFAHYVDGLVNGQHGHGPSFKEVCKVLGVRNDEAHYNIAEEVIRSSHVLEKIKKLLALSESSNINESQSALIKAKQLMREYGIQERESSNETIHRIILSPYVKLTQEYNTIIHIVRQISNTWVLLSVLPSGEKVIYAHGTKTECEIASYLFDYLKRELAHHYQTARRTRNLSSNAKTSFYVGVQHEMEKRFQSQKIAEVGTGLSLFVKENESLARQHIYTTGGIRVKNSSTRVTDLRSFNVGKTVGKDLRIRTGVSNSGSRDSGRFLS